MSSSRRTASIHRLGRLALGAFATLAIFSVGNAAEAQAVLRVVPVPWVATDPTIPHQAYNGHATTLKAIARGGNGSYSVEWDPEGDGTYLPAVVRTNRYDLSMRFDYPAQAVTATFQARIRVTSGAETVTAIYPVRVFADVPADPALATDRQLQVMRSVAVDDALWYLHVRLVRDAISEENPLTGAQARAYLPNDSSAGYQDANTAGALWSFSLNGHFAAFPAAYLGEFPNPAENTQRWEQDPYAEDAMRLVNELMVQFSVLTGITAADEANRVGFYPEVQVQPIFGTDDGIGLWVVDAGHDTYIVGHVLSALSVARLQGYVAQVGDPTYVLGRRFEYINQQLVDGVVHAQVDAAGTSIGSWGYVPNQAVADSSTSLWGITGLWHADEFARAAGVIVPNVARARAAEFLAYFMTPVAGTRCVGYRSGNTCGFTTTSLFTLTTGWLGANQFAANDTRLAFPSYNAITRGTLRTHHDQTLAFINQFFMPGFNGSIGWNQSFITAADRSFANRTNDGNHYAMLHWQDAARAVEPEIETFGTSNWARLFSQYMINNQRSDGRWQATNRDNISDQQGSQTLQTVWALLVLSPDAIPPLAIGNASITETTEGTSIRFDGTASDPGTGNPTYVWSFGNGQTRAGQIVDYAFPDNGIYAVTLTSTSEGGSSVDTIQVTITNVAPTADAGADLVANEGSAVPLNVTFTDPGTADTHTFGWVFGDLTADGTTQAASHAYADNGTYTAVATVTDDDGGSDTDEVSVVVNNVAPTITSTPDTIATEGSPYSYTLTYTDPGTADTHACTAPTAPAGSILVGCTLEWSPNFSQAIGSAAPVRMCVTDNDGGEACQSYTITVGFVDEDNDGLPDSWEIDNFGNITAQDQFRDPDGDGMNNLQEFTNVTDPNFYDGPAAATASAPTCGGEIASLQTSLVANNATDPQGTALLYTFELYSDLGLTILVDSEHDIAQGPGTTTTWEVPVSLLENTRYYWRVHAEDQFVAGPWSAACSFFVNTVNEAPGVPRINSPAFGGQVGSFRPNLVIDNATDPDLDVLTYTFEVYRDPALSTLVTSQAARPSGAGATTTWAVNADLMEDRTYYWRARATDPDALAGDWSQTGQFFVTTMNAPPEPPALVSPQNGTVMAEVRPDLIILNADDSDLDPLVYDWQLATDDTFATIVASGADQSPQGTVNTHFDLIADLVEDTRYCWRARSDDGEAQSAYATACFLVSEVNNAPSVPTLNNPSDNGEVITTTPVYSWAPSTDPEGENISYEIEVRQNTTVVAMVTGVSGTVTSMTGELENGGRYTWRARAVDRSGGMSEFSADNAFTVDAPIDDPEVVVNGGGCQAADGSDAGSLGLLALGLLGLMWRRRESLMTRRTALSNRR